MITVERPLVDLHSHSDYSGDGGIAIATLEEIVQFGSSNPGNTYPDVLAVTDHDVIGRAVVEVSEASNGRIIVGEEITTFYRGSKIEIVGLYLKEHIAKGKDTVDVMKEIHAQGGLVYVPHPYDIAKKGVPQQYMNEIYEAGQFDIVEAYNSRATKRRLEQSAQFWAKMNGVVIASGTDAHGEYGLNGTGNYLSEYPTRETLVPLLGAAALSKIPATFRGRALPTQNRISHLMSNTALFGLQLVQQ